MSDDLISKGLDIDIVTTHQRFVEAMEVRLPAMPLESKERYFVILSSLVGKLETPDKHLREILEEMMVEAGAIILQELNAGR
jgi:hypothetical protein